MIFLSSVAMLEVLPRLPQQILSLVLRVDSLSSAVLSLLCLALSLCCGFTGMRAFSLFPTCASRFWPNRCEVRAGCSGLSFESCDALTGRSFSALRVADNSPDRHGPAVTRPIGKGVSVCLNPPCCLCASFPRLNVLGASPSPPLPTPCAMSLTH